jgi:signal transduction histidine kinase/CheY-like chemotaxis protein
MPPKGLHLLLVEDSPDDAGLVQQALRQAGLTLVLRQVDSAAAMAAALIEENWDLIISDYNLPGFSGTDALQLLREHSPDTPFIVVSGCIGEEAAVTLMKAGADDYVMKDNLARLAPAVERSLKEAQTRAQGELAQLALRESEARFKAIASNIPGTVLQLLLDANGSWSFSYVSEGCLALCGVTSRLLQRYPSFFFDLIVPEDSAAFAQSMQASARDLSDWNWEGRIRVSGSNEIKWANLRCSPRRLDDGSVLWEGILSNITQNKLAEIEVRRSHEQLSSLSAHVQSAKERERASIAREIHDDLGGTLTAIKIELMRLGKDLAPGAELALQHLRSTEALVDGALDTARRISTELRPGILDLGIVAAIEWQSAEFQKRMEMPCLVTCAQEEISLDGEISIALFRIFQETLTNIAKHAGASQVEVMLDAGADRVNLVVSDNGRGLADADLSKPNTFGIRGMQERAINLGGEASVSGSRAGTTVMVSVPRSIPAATQNPVDDEQMRLFGRVIQPSVPAPAPGGKPDAKGMGRT